MPFHGTHCPQSDATIEMQKPPEHIQTKACLYLILSYHFWWYPMSRKENMSPLLSRAPYFTKHYILLLPLILISFIGLLRIFYKTLTLTKIWFCMNIVLPRFAKNICHWPEKPRRDIAAASTGEYSSLIRSIIAIIVFITNKKKSAAGGESVWLDTVLTLNPGLQGADPGRWGRWRSLFPRWWWLLC